MNLWDILQKSSLNFVHKSWNPLRPPSVDSLLLRTIQKSFLGLYFSPVLHKEWCLIHSKLNNKFGVQMLGPKPTSNAIQRKLDHLQKWLKGWSQSWQHQRHALILLLIWVKGCYHILGSLFCLRIHSHALLQTSDICVLAEELIHCKRSDSHQGVHYRVGIFCLVVRKEHIVIIRIF